MLDAVHPEELDWIFFYSPKSWELYFDKYGAPKSKIGVIGKGTARMIQKDGLKVDFVPSSSDPAEAVKEFADLLGPNLRVLVPNGTLSKNRLAQSVRAGQLVEFPFYETIPAEHIPQSNADHLFFTSPSNADAYFTKHELMAGQRLYAIGKSTAHALSSKGFEDVNTLSEPTEEALWALLSD